MLRWSLLCSAVLAASSTVSLRAEQFPWCVEVDAFTKNCAFTGRDECIAVAKNVSSPATGAGRCVANPNYVAPPGAKASAKPSTRQR
jgi:hypothetical protein